MAFGLQNWLMLLGLSGVAIPILIHLLNRRRFDVVDWGAMRFLQVSEITRRKIFIEELLLLLLRMGLIAVLVLAMAAPWASGPLVEKLGLADNRDLVLVFDGSAPMSYTDDSDKSLHQKAVEWARDLLDRLAPGDNLAILQAREQVLPVVGELIADRRRLRKALDQLPAPSGACDWPLALEAAQQVLKNSHRSRREIILLGDGRKAGWADERTLGRWKLLAGQVTGDQAPPRLWMVALDRPDDQPVPNWSLTPLRSGRARASTSLAFGSTLKVLNQKYERPYSLRYRVDRLDSPTPDSDEKTRGIALPLPVRDDLRDGRLPLSFTHTFDGPGSHLVSLIVEPDRPERKKDKTLIGEPIKDRIPADNRQDFAVMLPLLPVLLVDGLPPQPKRQGADFLQVALAPTAQKTWLVRARVVPLEELVPSLGKDIGPEPNTRPRVLVLCDVAFLTTEQREAVGKFVAAGGGLLVTHGPNTNAVQVNKDLYRNGNGFLPTSLEEVVGNEEDPIPTDGVTPDPAAHPQPSTFSHPALELFRGNQSGGLGNARFPRWWKLTQPQPLPGGRTDNPSHAVVAASLTTRAPFLVEKQYGKGRVIQCCVPLNDTWGTNLHRREVPEFTLLAHELIVYLAGSRGFDYNLTPGQPLVYQPMDDESADRATLKAPHGETIELEGKDGVLVHKDTRLPGVYTLTTSRNRTVYFVVQPDPRGSDDLSLCSKNDRDQVTEVLGVKYLRDRADLLAGTEHDLWWWLLLGVIALLCSEVFLTRRIARNR